MVAALQARRCRGLWREQVREEYLRRAVEAAGTNWRTWSVSVPERFEGKPVYDLVLFTRHPGGVRLFNDSASRAYIKHHDRSWEPEDPSGLRQTLFGSEPVTDPGPGLIRTVRENVLRAVQQGQSFVVSERLDVVVGEVSGKAGAKHIRAALAELHKEGHIGDPKPKAKGLENYTVTSKRPPAP